MDEELPSLEIHWLTLLRVWGNIFHGKQALMVTGLGLKTTSPEIPVLTWYVYADKGDPVPAYLPLVFQLQGSDTGVSYDVYEYCN